MSQDQPMFDWLYDNQLLGNKIIRHHEPLGFFSDLSVDETIAKGWNNYQGWACSAGIQHFYVDFDGDLFRGNCRVGGPLGNVFRQDYQMPNDWIVCPYKLCGCGADLLAPKVKKASHKKKLKNTFSNGRTFKFQRKQTPQQPVAVETAFQNPMKRVQWDIGRRCNYDCSYCWPEVHNNHEPLKSYETMKNAADALIQKISGGSPIFFMFGGGEPTLYPGFDQLMSDIAQQGHQITVTTNGSRNAKYYANLIQSCSVNVSVHFESADWGRLLDNFKAMIKPRRQGDSVGALEVKLMVPPGVMSTAKRFEEEMFKIEDFHRYASWSFVPLRTLGKSGESPEKSATLQNYSQSEFQDFKNQSMPS